MFKYFTSKNGGSEKETHLTPTFVSNHRTADVFRGVKNPFTYIYLYDYFLWFKNIYCFITVTFDECSDFRPSAGMETDEYPL